MNLSFIMPLELELVAKGAKSGKFMVLSGLDLNGLSVTDLATLEDMEVIMSEMQQEPDGEVSFTFYLDAELTINATGRDTPEIEATAYMNDVETDLYNFLDDRERRKIDERVDQEAADYDAGYGDYLYEMEKDRRLGL